MGAFDIVSVSSSSASNEWLRLAALARKLAFASLGWLAIEGTVGIFAGIGASSIALVGFGLDSAIEALASVIVLWRFTGQRTLSDGAERRAQRMVALCFFLLAPYLAVEALQTLAGAHHPNTSVVGIVLCACTLLICPCFGIAKQRLGNRLGSVTAKGEGRQNLVCAGLAAGTLGGLLVNTCFAIWWLDPCAGLAIAVVCALAGRQAWRGEGCGCSQCDVPKP